MVAFVGFFAMHMLMVAATGFARNLNAITGVNRAASLDGVALFLLAIALTVAFKRMGDPLLVDAHPHPAANLKRDRRQADGPPV